MNEDLVLLAQNREMEGGEVVAGNGRDWVPCLIIHKTGIKTGITKRSLVIQYP